MKSKPLHFRLFFFTFFFLLAIPNAFSQIVVSWSLQFDSIADGGLGANSNSTFMHSVTGAATYDTNGASISGWDTPQYWYTSSFSTIGLKDIYFTAQMMSDPDGPSDFQLQYKIGTGSWIDVGSVIQLTTSESGIANIYLPVECSNKPDISLRINNSTTNSVSGGSILNSAFSYIRYVEVGGTNPAAPTTQVSSISLVSVTPTTITITANTGNGSNWVLLMNTTNSFTVPSDDTNPTGNLTYSGSGSQIMSNLPATTKTLTVTVPASTNQYYFRAYGYNYNDGMTRFLSNIATSNPKLCNLEIINTPTVANVRLTTATLGGTISTPTKTTVSERGIYWGTSPNITSSNTKVSQTGNPGGGTFTVNVTNLTRSSTIYFKAFATNSSGTIMTSEMSFSNVPTFSGTGNWETAGNWNVLQIPGSTGIGGFGSSTDSPVINGNCTIAATNTVNNLTINSGNNLTINPAIKLTINGTLSNTSASGLRIKASSSAANGSLIFANPGNNSSVPASVEMYSKAYTDSKYHWQYFGIPVQSTTVGSTFTNIGASGQRVRKYDESNIDPSGLDVGLWKPAGAGNSMTAGQSLVPIDGYEVVQPSATTYTFTGNLFTSNINRTLTYLPNVDWPGNFIISNPFTAAIDISKINFGSLDAAVYIYNTGSREEWQSNSGSSTPGSSPGTYSVSTGGFAGIFGVPSQIPSMQGFLVKGSSTSTISIPYSSLISSTTQMRSPKANEFPATRIDAIGNQSSDRLWIFSGSNFTRKYDNGWDGPKIIVPGATQLYAIEDDGNYQIAALNDINETNLGFNAGYNGICKLVFNHQNIETIYGSIYLIDLKENIKIDITENGSEYSFSTLTTDNPNRFKIVTNTTDKSNPVASKSSIFSTEKSIYIQNGSNRNGTFAIFNLNGKIIREISISPNTMSVISTADFPSGIYIGKLITESVELTKRLIFQ